MWPAEVADFIAQAERPLRVASTDITRTLTRAAHAGESVEVRYFSMHSGTAAWRRISPRTFGFDGLRWHVRAFCHQHEEFRDFVIGRMKGVRSPTLCVYPDRVDTDWMTEVIMVIEVAADLSASKRKALEMDYGMSRGQLKLPVRRAMVTYTARRLGFVGDWWQPDALPMLNELKELCWRSLRG